MRTFRVPGNFDPLNAPNPKRRNLIGLCQRAGAARADDYAVCGGVRRRSGNPALLTSTLSAHLCRRSVELHRRTGKAARISGAPQ